MILTDEQIQAQIDELQKAIALLPKEFTLSIGFLEKQLHSRVEYFNRLKEERAVRISVAQQEKLRQQRPAQIPKDKLLGQLYHNRALVAAQLDRTLPFDRPLIEGRLREIDSMIKNLEEKISNDNAA